MSSGSESGFITGLYPLIAAQETGTGVLLLLSSLSGLGSFLPKDCFTARSCPPAAASMGGVVPLVSGLLGLMWSRFKAALQLTWAL